MIHGTSAKIVTLLAFPAIEGGGGRGGSTEDLLLHFFGLRMFSFGAQSSCHYRTDKHSSKDFSWLLRLEEQSYLN